MLSDNEVRELLRLAGGTVEVQPAAAPRPVRRRAWPALAAAVAVAAVLAVVLVLTGLPGNDRRSEEPPPVAPAPSSDPSAQRSSPTAGPDAEDARAAGEALLSFLRGGAAPRTAGTVDLRSSWDDYWSGPELPSPDSEGWPSDLVADPAARAVASRACLGESPRPDLELVAGARITVPRDADDCTAPAVHVWLDGEERIRFVDLVPWERPPGEPGVSPALGRAPQDFVDWVQGDYAKGTFPFVEEPVLLLLGGRRVGTTDARGQDAWTFRCEGGYAGRDCPVFLDPHLFEQELAFEAGVPDLICAPMSPDLPSRLRDAEAVTITPAVSDCTNGYGITLWLDDDGRIFAVNLQLAEP